MPKKPSTTYTSPEHAQAQIDSLKKIDKENGGAIKAQAVIGTAGPKKYSISQTREQTRDIQYHRFVNREDSRIVSRNLKLISMVTAFIVLGLGIVLLAMVAFNINRGDLIFLERLYVGGAIGIPYDDWHAWLQNLSGTLTILGIVAVGVTVANFFVQAYYSPRLSNAVFQDMLDARAMADDDNEARQWFKERYGNLYEEMLAGKVSVVAAQAPKPVPAALPAIGKLPAIKAPPMVSIGPPGPMKLPKPLAATPPPIPGTTIKKKPAGPVEGEKKIYVRCERCQKTLHVAIPKKLVLDNELEVVPVSIIHGEDKDKHILTVFLDPDFKSRRDRVSDMITLEV